MKKSSKTKKKTKRNTSTKYYYLFKMNTVILTIISLIILLFCGLIFYLIYGNNSVYILEDNMYILVFLYIPYLVLHELLHSLGYVIYGADFKNITYGCYLEKGILCCLCKQRIDKRNILHSSLYPFVFIGIITLIIGIIFNLPFLVILSMVNIAGSSGDLVTYYYLSKLNDYEFSECNDPMCFALYSKNDLSNLKMFGLEFIGKKYRIEKNDLRKLVISKESAALLITFYALLIFVILV